MRSGPDALRLVGLTHPRVARHQAESRVGALPCPAQEPLDPDYDPWAGITPEQRAEWEAAMAQRSASRRRQAE